MEYKILNRWNSEVIYKADATDYKAFVLQALKSGADLRSADLSGANLRSANLRSADLRSADLSGANLRSADLRSADLRSADLRSADLRSANLRSADLSGADLRSADLSGAKEIPLLAAAQASIVPEQGEFTGWKKCQNEVIVKVLIPADAMRSNATGRKCRAEYVKVLEVIGATNGISKHDKQILYEQGKITKCDAWEPNRWIECGGGIHFFITRIEAENY